jgi:hypothetical protein
MSMASPDTLRYTRLPLTHGSGAIPAVGFGTLIPDPLATKQATKTALEVGFRHSRLEFTQTIDNNDLLALIVATITYDRAELRQVKGCGIEPVWRGVQEQRARGQFGQSDDGFGPDRKPR